jgi:hypothetical protein
MVKETKIRKDMISYDIMEKYLYDIFEVEFKYAEIFEGYVVFLYNDVMLGYKKEDNSWGRINTNELIDELYYDKLKKNDITVWLRKRKLEKL